MLGHGNLWRRKQNLDIMKAGSWISFLFEEYNWFEEMMRKIVEIKDDANFACYTPAIIIIIQSELLNFLKVRML